MNQIFAVLGCFVIVAISSQSCLASSLPEPASSISYSPEIPSSIVKYRSAKARSRFYGIATIQGKQLAFHFYDVASVDQSTPLVAGSEGRFDIFSITAVEYHRIILYLLNFKATASKR